MTRSLRGLQGFEKRLFTSSCTGLGFQDVGFGVWGSELRICAGGGMLTRWFRKIMVQRRRFHAEVGVGFLSDRF